MTKEKQSLSYLDAGVDIDEADRLVDNIKHLAKKTTRSGVLGGIGGFGALFELQGRYKNPVLVSGTDGVGTKLKLAIDMKHHSSIGIDLVAMCANDVLTTGAEPLFFLDYYATGKLDTAQATSIISGISEGCKLANMALIGGETAEMPGLYQKNDYDLAGFCVGIVEKAHIIDGTKVHLNDVLIGLASSGPHANGYSLIRKVISHCNASLNDPFAQTTLGNILLNPTRIYVKTIHQLLSVIDIHAMAHITGGGLVENIPRVLPAYTQAVINSQAWTWPKIFEWLQQQGNISLAEMRRTFNLGIGMVICVGESEAKNTLDLLAGLGETAWVIGHIASSTAQNPQVIFH